MDSRCTFVWRLCCTTHKAACGIETFLLPSGVQKEVSCTTHKAACGIETSKSTSSGETPSKVAPPTKPRAALKQFIDWCDFSGLIVAPPTKPRAALKPLIHRILAALEISCTTHKAACGIETRSLRINPRSMVSLHHPQSRVRHERPYRLAALATSPIAMGEAKIP